MPLRMVVGLGNPGKEYEDTRHNVGFEVVRLLAERTGTALERPKFPGLGRTIGRLGRVRDHDGSVLGFLMEPWTFMNLSGQAVSAVVRREEIDPVDILVVVDDFHLELGRLRIRPRGSSGGHNGLKSIESCLGSQDYVRLRIGIGDPGSKSVDHVLSRFSKREREERDLMVVRATDACEQWLRGESTTELMSRYNAAANDSEKG